VRERGAANGLVFAGVGIGSGLTPPLVTAIILQFGWRASFWFSALIGVTAGLVWYFIARDTPEQHPMVGLREQAVIECGRNTLSGVAKDIRALNNGKQCAPSASKPGKRFTTVLALTASYFTYGYIAWIFFAWIYIYLAQVRGLNLKTSAVYAMFPFIAMTAGSLLGGLACDRLVRHYGLRLGRCLVPALSFALTAVLLVLGSRVRDAHEAGLILACGAGILYLAQSCFFAVAADIAGKHVAVITGIVNMGGQIGGACTASLTPLIAAHFGWEASFMTAAVLAMAGSIAWIGIDPGRTLDARPDSVL
jgi:ACS family glucarate transporter-like MFS transporter